jgi:hypothetical protein
MAAIVHRRHLSIDVREERIEGRSKAAKEQNKRRDRWQRPRPLDRGDEGLRQRPADLRLGQPARDPQPAQLNSDRPRKRGIPQVDDPVA